MTTTDRDTLRAQVARIRPGDDVRIRYGDEEHWTIIDTFGTDQKVWRSESGNLCVGLHVLWWSDAGAAPALVLEVLAHEPASLTVADLDAAPTWTVAREGSNRPWVKDRDGLWYRLDRPGRIRTTCGLLAEHPRLRIVSRPAEAGESGD